jgi:hypothetical protein
VPIERRQILGYEIATISEKVLEIARAKIINHRETRLRKFFLQLESEVRADEAGASGDN